MVLGSWLEWIGNKSIFRILSLIIYIEVLIAIYLNINSLLNFFIFIYDKLTLQNYIILLELIYHTDFSQNKTWVIHFSSIGNNYQPHQFGYTQNINTNPSPYNQNNPNTYQSLGYGNDNHSNQNINPQIRYDSSNPNA